MLNQKPFWLVQMIGLSALYAYSLWLALSGQPTHMAVLVSALLLGAHVLEIPLAMRQLKAKQPSMARLIPLTILFGLIWWIPARRGVFEVK